jgi:transposase
MGNEGTVGGSTSRRYSPQDKARAVRLVRQLRKELGTSHGTIQRVAEQIGCGVESLRTWVKQADIDEGVEPGVTSVEAVHGQADPRARAGEPGVAAGQ